MNSYIRKLNAANLFVMPILGFKREKLLRLGMVEAFIKDELGELEWENCLYLLFRPPSWEEFNSFVKNEREEGRPIVDEYHHKGWAILIYKLPEEWKKDIDIVMTGKFSQVSKGYKQLFSIYVTIAKEGELVEEMSTQHLIFMKAQEVKDYWKKELDLNFQEDDQVWHFYPEREILNEEQLKRIENR